MLKKKYKNKAVFFDRDGVINYDYGYVYKINDFKFKKNIFKTIRYLNKKNFLIIVVTNQSGIGRGYYEEKDVLKLHKWMKKKFVEKKGKIHDIFYSPYYKYSKKKYSLKEKKRRKPNIGMIIEAKNKWSIDLKKSYLIGDRVSDKKLASNAKLKFIRINIDTDIFNIVSNKII